MTDWCVHLADVLDVPLMSSRRLNHSLCTTFDHNGIELTHLFFDLVIAIEGKLEKHIAHKHLERVLVLWADGESGGDCDLLSDSGVEPAHIGSTEVHPRQLIAALVTSERGAIWGGFFAKARLFHEGECRRRNHGDAAETEGHLGRRTLVGGALQRHLY